MPARHCPTQVSQHGVSVILVWRCHTKRRLEFCVTVRFGYMVSSSCVWWAQDERCHVEAGQGKLNRRVDLPRARARLGAGREALEVNDKKLRCTCDGDAFSCLSFLTAVRTPPNFVSRKHLGRTIRSQAVANVDESSIWCWGNFHADGPKGFVRRGRIMAGRALQARNVLSRKELRKFAIVAMHVAIPFAL